jgi:hypothetical protein
MNRTHIFDAQDEDAELLEALPEGFDTGFPIAFASEESAEPGNLPDDLAQARRRVGRLLFRQNVSALPLSSVNKVSADQSGCMRPSRTRRARRHATTL